MIRQRPKRRMDSRSRERVTLDSDHVRAFPAYERAMAEPVRNSRALARRAAKTLVPNSRPGWARPSPESTRADYGRTTR